MQNKDFSSRQSGSAVMVALGVVALIALGVLGYFGYQMQQSSGGQGSVKPAAGSSADAAADDPAGRNVVEPGNPVVARVGSQEITRLDVFNFIRELPENLRSAPVEQLYPMALEQVINSRIVNDKVSGVDLSANPEVQKQLAEAKEQIERNVFIQQELDKRVTDAKLKAAYKKYVAELPAVEEIKARHILVADEAKARELIEQIKGGASFEDLAKENSTDGTAPLGGELGYFAKASVVPEFGEAAFSLSPGSMSETPVQTQFGYHIIKVEDKRTRPAPTLEQATPFLEGNLRREELDALLEGWRESVAVEKFDINGDKLESPDAPLIPVRGQDDAAQPADSAPAAAPADTAADAADSQPAAAEESPAAPAGASAEPESTPAPEAAPEADSEAAPAEVSPEVSPEPAPESAPDAAVSP